MDGGAEHESPPRIRGVVECAVVVRRAAGSLSRFPAMPRAMLTLASDAGGAAAVGFHAMSTRAVTHTHVQAVCALGLVLPPETGGRNATSSPSWTAALMRA